MLRFVLFPIVAVILFFLAFVFYKPKCQVPNTLLELANYHYQEWNLPKMPEKLTFQFKDVIAQTENKPVLEDFSDLVEKLKVSVIKGEKEYLLINGFFIEKGKTFGGIKFFGGKERRGFH